MVKNLFLFFCSWVLVKTSFSQKDPTTVLAEVQRKLDSVMKNNPEIKKYAGTKNKADASVNNIPEISANVSAINPFARKTDTAFLSKIKIPPRDSMAIASIPAKAVTKKELVSFIADLSTRLKDGMKKVIGEQPIDFSDYDANSLSNASVMAWYTGQAVGDRSLELALDAAGKDPDNSFAMNNLGAVLTLCAFPEKAIPILDYVNQQQPGNSTVTNNLGQAYLLLGDQQKATQYLLQTIQKSPTHPNANFSLACINYANGNKSAAQSYCENSLRGAYIDGAWVMLKAINPKAKLMDYIRHRYKQPETFSPDKYPLLPQCRNANDVPKLRILYPDYKKMLTTLREKYEKKAKEEQKWVAENLAKNTMQKINERKDPLRPFGWFANAVLSDILETHGEKLMEMQKYDKQFEAQLKELNDKFEAEKKTLDDKYGVSEDEDGEGFANPDKSHERCNALNELANNYLPQFADLREQWQKKWLYEEKDYFNDYSFWCYIASTDDHHYHQLFYQLVSEYLTFLGKLNHTRFIACMHKGDTTHNKVNDLEFEEGKCPFKAKIDVQVEEKGKTNTPASFEIDCEDFAAKFKMGNGISFTTKANVNGTTTLAFNGGLDVKEVIGGKMQFYMTFGGNQPFDVGFNWDYNMNLPDALGGKNTAGWGVSIINGVDFRGSGKLQSRLSSAAQEVLGRKPDATQVNPNVKMYNH